LPFDVPSPRSGRREVRKRVLSDVLLGEIVNLKWTNVERKDDAAVLGGFISVGAETKGHRAWHIPINAVVKEVLDAQKPVQAEKGFVPLIFGNVRFKKRS